jgi:hypothetical protein
MPIAQKLIAIILSVSLLLFIIELIRRRHLKERYALLWLATGVILLILSVNTNLLFYISGLLGIAVASNALFFLSIIFLVLIVLSLTVVVSSLSKKNVRLTQEFAILSRRLEEISIRLQMQDGDNKKS